jgi:hypothetical protein
VLLLFDQAHITSFAFANLGSAFNKETLVLVILTKENILKIPDQEEFITEISKLLDSLKIVGDINNTVNINSYKSFTFNYKDYIISDNTKYIINLLQKSLKDQIYNLIDNSLIFKNTYVSN